MCWELGRVRERERERERNKYLIDRRLVWRLGAREKPIKEVAHKG
jgi:hypothetical protein